MGMPLALQGERKENIKQVCKLGFEMENSQLNFMRGKKSTCLNSTPQ
jgi:hypothetical protein